MLNFKVRKVQTNLTLNCRKLNIGVLILTSILILVFAGCDQTGRKQKGDNQKDAGISESVNKKADEPSDSTDKNSITINMGQDKLAGKWMRIDGNYTIEIKSVFDDGRLEAAYFNPGSINIEKAGWVIKDNKLFIEVLLRDVNYPGSVYTLEYSGDNDYLIGNYFQAVQQANYDVIFIRRK